MFSEEVASPENDRYLAVKALKLMKKVFGSKGAFLYNLATYLRWVDDMVDENTDMSPEAKIGFVRGQMDLVLNNSHKNLRGPESIWQKLPKSLEPVSAQIKMATVQELAAILDDAEHDGLVCRSPREIRHYNWRTLASCMCGLLLIVNGKRPKETKKFWKWVQAAMTLADLEQLGEDLNQGVVKLPMPGHEGEKVSKEQVLEVYDEYKFTALKQESIREMIKNTRGFWEMGIPVWQWVICAGYALQAVATRQIGITRKKSLRDLSC